MTNFTGGQLFLHFLNREACDQARIFIDQECDLTRIAALCVFHCCGMSGNISQILEYSHAKLELISAISLLSKCGIIELSSAAPSIDAFFSSRQILYRNVQERYTFFFEPPSFVGDLRLGKTNRFDMTALLRRDLMADPALPFTAKMAHQSDLSIASDKLKQIQKWIAKSNGVAITRANLEAGFGKSTPSKIEMDAVGRVISSLYMNNYGNQTNTIPVSGAFSCGYNEDIAFFPFTDLICLIKNNIFKMLTQRWPPASLINEFVPAYSTQMHMYFCQLFYTICDMCLSIAKSQLNSKEISLDTISAVRSKFIFEINRILPLDTTVQNEFTTIERALVMLCDDMLKARTKLANNYPHVLGERETIMGSALSILVTCATDREEDALFERLGHFKYHKGGPELLGDAVIIPFFKIGQNHKLSYLRTGMGSGGSSGSQLTLSDSLKDGYFDFVIAAGICFGLDRSTQTLGDIIAATEICDYEHARLGEGIILPRGEVIPCAPALISLVRSLRNAYELEKIKIVCGPYVSGSKLVDNREFINELKVRYPRAVAGDMEGAGLISAAFRQNKKFVLIKSICDWGYEKNDKAQETAALNAMRATVDLIEMIFRR